MLFNSYEFILVFLPIVLVGFQVLSRTAPHRYTLGWLLTSSLFFYGWWNPKYLLLICVSILGNFWISKLFRYGQVKKAAFVLGLAGNLATLGYYKYTNFLIQNLNVTLGTDLSIAHIVLPLGISFFTFQQVAFLITSYRREYEATGLVEYALFVTFFPQLIAGPIVHHYEVVPQFRKLGSEGLIPSHVAIGLTIFFIGLCKKAVLADQIAAYSTPVFAAAEKGVPLTMFEAWAGSLSYSMQLYFDFSGYSDMALGLALLFGFRMPVNFFSPYKARDIIDFWRRWHITLSRFLKDYIYIPLGGNRKGPTRRYVNLFVTMLLGGLWHGAGWTFVLWGALHGVYLIVNHGWYALRRALGVPDQSQSFLGRAFGRGLTFAAVVVAWVVFRAETVHGAANMLAGMMGLHGVSLPPTLGPTVVGRILEPLGADFLGMFHNGVVGVWTPGLLLLSVLLVIVLYMPNTVELTRRYRPAIMATIPAALPPPEGLAWRPTWRWAFAMGIVVAMSMSSLRHVSEFLYFQF